MEFVIGIGEYALSKDETDTIKTYALATCIAVIAYSPVKKIGGMVHIALPAPAGKDTIHGKRPGYYASTGIPLLINKLCTEMGCNKGELQIKIYGGADSINENDVFNIGKRNIEAVNNILCESGLGIHTSDVGGTNSRTIELEIATGNVMISLQAIRI